VRPIRDANPGENHGYRQDHRGNLTGRVGTPDNFNLWVGWKWQDRGMQNLADEPLWSVDFATGEIINGVADGDPNTARIS
jgi:hypothetical protein